MTVHIYRGQLVKFRLSEASGTRAGDQVFRGSIPSNHRANLSPRVPAALDEHPRTAEPTGVKLLKGAFGENQITH